MQIRNKDNFLLDDRQTGGGVAVLLTNIEYNRIITQFSSSLMELAVIYINTNIANIKHKI